jgi:serine/threonine protein kinase
VGSRAHSLGKPPSLETITRDTYAPGSSYGTDFVKTLALSIAKAGQHLHSVGLSHGDLYAHNILVNPQTGEAKLADFGAAFYYGGPSAPHAADYEAMELRAYGLLLLELIDRHDGQGMTAPGASERLAALQSLATVCSADAAERPKGFTGALQLLERIQ